MFDKVLPKENKKKTIKKRFSLKSTKTGKKSGRLMSLIKHIGRLMYIIKDSKKTIKRHHYQIRKRYSEDINNQKKELMKVIYDLFNVPMPSVAWGEMFK